MAVAAAVVLVLVAVEREDDEDEEDDFVEEDDSSTSSSSSSHQASFVRPKDAILPPLGEVGQARVGVRELRELLRCVRGTPISVRVVFKRELPVGRRDLSLRGPSVHPEECLVVAKRSEEGRK